MNRRNVLGVIGFSMVGAAALAPAATSAQEPENQTISKRLLGRRIRVYPDSLEHFFLGTVDHVEGPMIYLKDVKLPITEPAREALIDTRSVRLITLLNKDEK